MTDWPLGDEEGAATLPAWTTHGALPVGDYWPNRNAFEEALVKVDGSKTREAIYAGWKRHQAALQKAGCDESAACLLNGSFTTNKQDPADIDLVVSFHVTPETATGKKLLNDLLPLLQGPDMKVDFKCDAYPLVILPEGHPDYESVTKKFIKYWTDWFSRDRAGREKGRVWSRVTGLRPCP